MWDSNRGSLLKDCSVNTSDFLIMMMIMSGEERDSDYDGKRRVIVVWCVIPSANICAVY